MNAPHNGIFFEHFNYSSISSFVIKVINVYAQRMNACFDCLGVESWVDVSLSPGRVTPVAVPTVGLLNGSGQLSSHIGEEYLRLLKEAQRESNYSSSRVSVASSRRDSRCAT